MGRQKSYPEIKLNPSGKVIPAHGHIWPTQNTSVRKESFMAGNNTFYGVILFGNFITSMAIVLYFGAPCRLQG
jgi:hypothetical protein